ncbi:MAG: S8 family serine peptidase [Phycisphaerales bacterium]|nr:S8 family serine peptidase [Phycisphaerales bacterium]
MTIRRTCSLTALSVLLVATGVSAADVDPGVHRRLAEVDTTKVWIHLTDKDLAGPALDAALAAAAETLSPRTATRRAQRRTAPGLVDQHDLPVAPAYLDTLARLGVEPVVVSRWLNAVSAYVDEATLGAIGDLPFVRAIELVRRGELVDPVSSAPAALPLGGGFYGLATTQLEQIGLPALHDTGATGAGIVVGILDTGFKRDHEAFNNPDHPLTIVAEHDFINDDPDTGPEPGDPSSQHRHGTLILGTLGAYMPGTLVGGAYDASFILCKTEDTSDEYQGEEDFYVAALEFIEANGGDVATSSLRYTDWYTDDDYDGVTAVTSIGVNIATSNGVFCCTSVGNSGHDSNPATSNLGAPADALEVISVGAVESTGEIVGFSSDGPTADGRVKPEVLAQGSGTYTVDADVPDEYRTASGTSLSCPLVAGAVACLAQAQPGWTVPQMRDLLFRTASYFEAFGTFDPLYVEGYGIIDAAAANALDCNGNGSPDDEDIAGGGSADVDGDGIPDECQCGPDIDGTGDVGFGDLLAVISAWGPCTGSCVQDLDGSGDVGFADLLMVISAWGPCA